MSTNKKIKQKKDKIKFLFLFKLQCKLIVNLK